MKRIRGRKLQARRARWFRRHPLCIHHLARGLLVEATELDHIVALDHGGPDTEGNLQGLCAECHRIKSAADAGKTPKPTIGRDGWPIDNPGGDQAVSSERPGNRPRRFIGS